MTITKINRIGEISKNRHGNTMTITKYNGANDIEITFDNGYITNSYYKLFIKGTVSNPLDKTHYGVGYYGIGKYTSKYKSYFIWTDMLRRCYDSKYQSKYNTYIDCSVCKEWYNYQNFAKWYEDNFYQIDGQKMHIDKDILYKGNKIYSPETCVFTPEEINNLFIKSNKTRGNYPIGVYLNNNGDRYVAGCRNINKKNEYLGTYDTPEEAFNTYKDYKENVIKRIADKYYGLIPDKLYKAMYNYVVDITD